MGTILNSKGQLQLFRGRYEGSYFVDKSEILIKLRNLWKAFKPAQCNFTLYGRTAKSM